MEVKKQNKVVRGAGGRGCLFGPGKGVSLNYLLGYPGR